MFAFFGGGEKRRCEDVESGRNLEEIVDVEKEQRRASMSETDSERSSEQGQSTSIASDIASVSKGCRVTAVQP